MTVSAGLRAALGYAVKYLVIRGERLEETKTVIKAWGFSPYELGLDMIPAQKAEAREVLHRLLTKKKQKGKKALSDLLDVECERYNIERRGRPLEVRDELMNPAMIKAYEAAFCEDGGPGK